MNGWDLNLGAPAVAEVKVAGRQPRGWEQIVSTLASTRDRARFHQQMLDLQCRIVAAQYGLLWRAGTQGPEPITCWPHKLRPNAIDPKILTALNQAASAGFERGISRVVALNVGAAVPPNAGQAYAFVTTMRRGDKVEAVSTAVAECVDLQAIINTTAAQRELAAGLWDGYTARLEAAEASEQAQQVRQAMALLATTQDATGFRGSCLNLVNQLAQTQQAERVALGWVRGRSIKLAAVTDADDTKRQSDEAGRLELAMAECLDQEQPLIYPVPDDAEPMLAQAATYSHRQLVEGHADRHVLSLPLRNGEELTGVLTLERHGRGFDAPTVQRLQLTADVIAPQLRDRYHSDRWLIGHAWQSVRRFAAYFVGARHVGWKLLSLALVACALYVALGTWEYKVSAPFRLEAHDRRIVSPVYAGRVERVLVEPGDEVQAGQLLAELASRELRLQLIDAQSRQRSARIEYDQARTEGLQSEAARANTRIAQIQAQIDLLTEQIERTAIRSPMDGVVLAGYWHDRVGSMVEQGEAMFEVAPMSRLVAVVRIKESDIHRVMAGADGMSLKPQLGGELATRAEPRRKFAIAAERIVPVARPMDGANIFELWCELEDSEPWLRPGMEGTARLEMGRRPIAWILTHRLADTVRLWLWW